MSTPIYQDTTLASSAVAFIQLCRTLYGDSRVLVGDVARVRMALASGAAPMLVFLIQESMSAADWDQASTWTSDPQYPFNVMVITNDGAPTTGPFVIRSFTA